MDMSIPHGDSCMPVFIVPIIVFAALMKIDWESGNNWRARYIERCTSGSEGGSRKPESLMIERWAPGSYPTKLLLLLI